MKELRQKVSYDCYMPYMIKPAKTKGDRVIEPAEYVYYKLITKAEYNKLFAEQRAGVLEREIKQLKAAIKGAKERGKLPDHLAEEVERLEAELETLKRKIAVETEEFTLENQKAVDNEVSVEILWAGFLILIVGTFSAFADIGASMLLMYAITDDYAKAVEQVYRGYFANGGISLATTFNLFDFSFYFDFALPSFGVVAFKVIFNFSIFLELGVGFLDFLIFDVIAPDMDLDFLQLWDRAKRWAEENDFSDMSPEDKRKREEAVRNKNKKEREMREMEENKPMLEDALTNESVRRVTNINKHMKDLEKMSKPKEVKEGEESESHEEIKKKLTLAAQKKLGVSPEDIRLVASDSVDRIRKSHNKAGEPKTKVGVCLLLKATPNRAPCIPLAACCLLRPPRLHTSATSCSQPRCLLTLHYQEEKEERERVLNMATEIEGLFIKIDLDRSLVEAELKVEGKAPLKEGGPKKEFDSWDKKEKDEFRKNDITKIQTDLTEATKVPYPREAAPRSHCCSRCHLLTASPSPSSIPCLSPYPLSGQSLRGQEGAGDVRGQNHPAEAKDQPDLTGG